VTVTGSADGPVHLWADGASRGAIARRSGSAVLDRVLVRANRRWSFSAISDRAREAALDPEDESLGDSGAADEPPEAVDAVPPGDAALGLRLPLGAVAGGAQFGTLVHEVLEARRFRERRILTPSCAPISATDSGGIPGPVDTETLVKGLRSAIETPLGPLLQRTTAAPTSRRSERIGELGFELRLGGQMAACATRSQHRRAACWRYLPE